MHSGNHSMSGSWTPCASNLGGPLRILSTNVATKPITESEQGKQTLQGEWE